jgi:hypothetical protein
MKNNHTTPAPELHTLGIPLTGDAGAHLDHLVMEMGRVLINSLVSNNRNEGVAFTRVGSFGLEVKIKLHNAPSGEGGAS